MKTMQVRLPDHIHIRLRELAREERISMNSFIVSSVSNEVIRQETRDFFKAARAQYDPRAFADALASVADAPISDSDRIEGPQRSDGDADYSDGWMVTDTLQEHEVTTLVIREKKNVTVDDPNDELSEGVLEEAILPSTSHLAIESKCSFLPRQH